jgi:hypothetical protein
MPVAFSPTMASRLLTVVLFVLPATALATESSDGSEGSSARAPLAVGASDAYPRQHGVFANLGVFSAVGFGGLTYAYAVSENWAVEAGLGLGLTGVQLSLMPKLAFGRNHRFVVGLGPSVGSMLDGQNTTSLWLNGDVGYEFRDDNGFSVSFVGGFTKGIAGCIAKECRPDGIVWPDDGGSKAVFSGRAQDYLEPQGRIIVGVWF